ncbi:catalase-like domain-containing protein [Gaertneriomyces semiglobifer]|nr:catalase-like domain-containing protein [Gaertneriomyces semiglobifer]
MSLRPRTFHKSSIFPTLRTSAFRLPTQAQLLLQKRNMAEKKPESLTSAILGSTPVKKMADAMGVDPRPSQRMSVFNQVNEGPAAIASRITGVSQKQAKDDCPYMTSNFGQVAPSLTHTMNIGGYPVSSDVFLFENQQSFNRSKTLERMVHPCGSGAFGYFETTTGDAEPLTRAAFLQGKGKRTPVFVRFSTVTYGREFPDSGRNPRGFAIKFYTEDGNYDIVGLNWPIFFVRDPMQGPMTIRSQQRNPRNFLIDYDSWYDFLANVPESMHAGTMLMSDHGTPVGWRFMDGYGCHTFKWVNKEGVQHYVKYHFLSEQGKKQFTWEEAIKMSGEDPDFAKRDLWDHIEEGGEAKWKICVQVMPAADAAKTPYDPFDVTKVWPHKDYPLKEIGRLVLNRNPENYHRDVEQAAFSPGSLVPGIEPSPDMLLNWRCFFYRDAQYHRLGGNTNIHQIPVNCPFMAKYYSPFTRDGALRTDANGGMDAHYFPHSFKDSPGTNPAADFAPARLMPWQQPVVSRQSPFKHEGDASDYDQVRELYTRVMKPQARANLHKNIAVTLKLVKDTNIRTRFLAQCYAVSPAYAEGIHSLLPADRQVNMNEVAELAKVAHKVGKEPQYLPRREE